MQEKAAVHETELCQAANKVTALLKQTGKGSTSTTHPKLPLLGLHQNTRILDRPRKPSQNSQENDPSVDSDTPERPPNCVCLTDLQCQARLGSIPFTSMYNVYNFCWCCLQ